LSGDLRDSIHVEEDGQDFAVIAGEFYGPFLHVDAIAQIPAQYRNQIFSVSMTCSAE
jgi:hypothetical protein